MISESDLRHLGRMRYIIRDFEERDTTPYYLACDLKASSNYVENDDESWILELREKISDLRSIWDVAIGMGEKSLDGEEQKRFTALVEEIKHALTDKGIPERTGKQDLE